MDMLCDVVLNDVDEHEVICKL